MGADRAETPVPSLYFAFCSRKSETETKLMKTKLLRNFAVAGLLATCLALHAFCADQKTNILLMLFCNPCYGDLGCYGGREKTGRSPPPLRPLVHYGDW